MSESNSSATHSDTGRPKSLKRQAARHVQDALAALVEVSKDAAAEPGVRTQAAIAILNCGQGISPASKAVAES